MLLASGFPCKEPLWLGVFTMLDQKKMLNPSGGLGAGTLNIVTLYGAQKGYIDMLDNALDRSII